MNVSIIGTGYVGLVTGACFSEMGVDVVCVDVNQQKIDNLRNGILPIYEPGLDDMVHRNVESGRLKFTTDIKEIVNKSDIIFIAVGTPSDKDGSADLKYVLEVAKEIGENLNKYTLVVTKSTVPVGTAVKVKNAIQTQLTKRGVKLNFDVASNPEFLKEGAALKDFMSPDRVVVGLDSPTAQKLMEDLYKPFLLNNFRVIFMDIQSAEMTKYAANAMLATRISFMNDIANLCEIIGADVNMVRKGMGSDGRIGNKFLYAGCGYGGSCFPKDVKALIKSGIDNGYNMEIIDAVERVNEKQKKILFSKLVKSFGGEQQLKGKTIAIWGLSFKPETDDMREAPSLILINQLLELGCTVRAYDPIAMEESKKMIGDKITYCENIYDTAKSAHAIVLVTEWKEFRIPNWKVLKAAMLDNIVVDGRNIYEYQEMINEGFKYSCIGK